MTRVEQLVRWTHTALAAAAGVHVSRSKVSRLCRDYVNLVEPTGVAFPAYLARQVAELSPRQAHVLTALYYRGFDPTGDRAAAVVDAGRTTRTTAERVLASGVAGR
ncbi:hypothetical protein ACFP6A_06020 [Quadrisphaera sp. GCM10027208]|uniref:hypothetical protein n=1 Tax=Quadrisphaera sp. GCM10027208 TaxID=3273423 RepID=UPI003613C955